MKDIILVEDADGEICPMNFTHVINVFIALIRERIFGSMQKGTKMTNEEAIEWIEVLRDGWDNATNVTACNMAIQALKMKQHNNILKDVIEATKESQTIQGG